MLTEVLHSTPENIERAAAALRAGELVAIPTETVYGLAGNAFDEAAVACIFAVKERPTFDPLIVHTTALPPRADVVGVLAARQLVDAAALSSEARRMVQRLGSAFWPGPLTIVLPRHASVPDLVTSGLDTVAVRVPRHPVTAALLAAAGVPLAAPSANRFSRISPTTARHVLEDLGGRVRWILDGGACEVGLESTVVAVGAEGLTLLRPGGITSAALEEVIGSPPRPSSADAPGHGSPGMLEKHYAPAKLFLRLPLVLESLGEHEWEALRRAIPEGTRRVGLLIVFGGAERAAELASARLGVQVTARALSSAGSQIEAAQQLFHAMRELDASEAEVLLAELPDSSDGLLQAIGDRLRRATRAVEPG